MKNVTTLIITLTFLSYYSSAQSLLPKKYGIKIGSNISNVISSPNEGVENIDNSSLIGFLGGFYMEIPLNDKWYINPELVYIQKGSAFTYSYEHDYEVNQRDLHNASSDLKLAYLELNPTLSYKTSGGLSLDFGPSLGYLLSLQYNILEDKGDNDTDPNHEILSDSEYEEESLDVGFNLGLSYYLNDNFLIVSRINTGLLSIGKVTKEVYTGSVNNPPRSNIYDLKNLGFTLSAAYLF